MCIAVRLSNVEDRHRYASHRVKFPGRPSATRRYLDGQEVVTPNMRLGWSSNFSLTQSTTLCGRLDLFALASDIDEDCVIVASV